jgi:hypothetical protein
MTQEITITATEDHYEMQFDGGDAYPVPTGAIDKLDDEFTPEEVGESITFRGEYKGVKHMKNFSVEEVIDGLNDDEDDETETQTDDDTNEDDGDETGVDVSDLEVGDRVENPSQRSGHEFEVVDIREKQTFDGTETVFEVKRVGSHGDLKGKADIIYEKDHNRWELVE